MKWRFLLVSKHKLKIFKERQRQEVSLGGSDRGAAEVHFWDVIRVDWYIFIDILRDRSAFISKVKQSMKCWIN